MTKKSLAVTGPLTCALALAPVLALAPAANAETVKLSRGMHNDDGKDPNGKLVLKVKVNRQGVPQKIVSAKAVNMDVTCLDPVTIEEAPAGEVTATYKKGMRLIPTYQESKTYFSTQEATFTTPDGWRFTIEIVAVDKQAKKILAGEIYGSMDDSQGRECDTDAYIKSGYSRE